MATIRDGGMGIVLDRETEVSGRRVAGKVGGRFGRKVRE